MCLAMLFTGVRISGTDWPKLRAFSKGPEERAKDAKQSLYSLSGQE
jgi:hypothetical protein